MIHGGWQSHEYESSRSHGCIRLRYQAIPALKAKWDNSTGNKRIPSWAESTTSTPDRPPS